MATIDRRGVTVAATDPAVQADPNPGLAVKAPCRVATTANVVLSGLQTIDGVAVAAGNRVLVKNQTDAKQNGIYNASTGAWTRAIDLDSNSEVAQGTQVFVTQGSTQANTAWAISSADPIVLGTNNISFTQVATSAASLNLALAQQATILALPLVTVGDQSATLASSRRLAAAAPITVSDGGAGQPITLALTTPLAAQYGGTGLTSFTALNNARLSKTASYTVVNADKGKTVALSGGGAAAIKTLTFPAASGLDADFWALVLNEDSRGWSIAPSGGTSFILWPGQAVVVFAQANVWQRWPSFQRWQKAGAIINVDPVFGLDANDGLATGAGAVLTIAKAYDLIRLYIDSQASPPTIQLADGTYSIGAGININYPLVGASQLLITGNNATPGNVVVSCAAAGNCFNARDLPTLTLSGMTLSTTGNGSTALSASQGAVIDIAASGPVNFNAFPLGGHISVATWASLNVLGNYTINGSSPSHLTVSNGGLINYGSFTVTGAASLAFTIFATAVKCGVIDAGGVAMIFAGFAGVTGQRYSAQQNGVISSSGTVYPGNAAGTTGTGGLYS